MKSDFQFLSGFSYSFWASRDSAHKRDYLDKRLDRLYSFYLFKLNCMLLFINKLIMRKNKAIHFDFRFIHFQ